MVFCSTFSLLLPKYLSVIQGIYDYNALIMFITVMCDVLVTLLNILTRIKRSTEFVDRSTELHAPERAFYEVHA